MVQFGISMKNRDVKSIVIVGGGSAGWMAAAILIISFQTNKLSLLTLIKLSLGVGESTLGHINYWMYALGIEEKDFLVETDASLKLSIKFTDLRKDYGHYHYPFGNIL